MVLTARWPRLASPRLAPPSSQAFPPPVWRRMGRKRSGGSVRPYVRPRGGGGGKTLAWAVGFSGLSGVGAEELRPRRCRGGVHRGGRMVRRFSSAFPPRRAAPPVPRRASHHPPPTRLVGQGGPLSPTRAPGGCGVGCAVTLPADLPATSHRLAPRVGGVVRVTPP